MTLDRAPRALPHRQCHRCYEDIPPMSEHPDYLCDVCRCDLAHVEAERLAQARQAAQVAHAGD